MNQRGFSLIELIVSIALFTSVMFIATGALLSIVNVNKKAQAQQSAINNINFALENMARNIRTGSTYRCSERGEAVVNDYSGTSIQISGDGADCSTGGNPGNTLAFNSNITGDAGVDTWAYWIKETTNPTTGAVEGAIYKATSIPCGSLGCTIGGKTFYREVYQVTADEIDIDKLRFIVDGSRTDAFQPRVMINVAGHAFVNENVVSPRRVDFSLQTSASQRALDK